MIPQLNTYFERIDDIGEIMWGIGPTQFPQFISESSDDKIYNTEEENAIADYNSENKDSGKDLSNFTHACGTYNSLPRFIKNLINKGSPCSIAFCKMYEICCDTEIGKAINNLLEAHVKLNIMCLAEAPGAFPLAILYYIGNRYPKALKELEKVKSLKDLLPSPSRTDMANANVERPGELYSYMCTTLNPSTIPTALGDDYKMIECNPSKWIYMDHTSPEDTEKFVKEHSNRYTFVTSDIGKVKSVSTLLERDMFQEQLGTFIAACACLENKGFACLKMFSCTLPSTSSLLKLATYLFDKTHMFKPLASRISNSENYWILTGFNRDRFNLEPLLSILRSAKSVLNNNTNSEPPYYPAFVHIDECIILRLYRLNIAMYARKTAIKKESLRLFLQWRENTPETIRNLDKASYYYIKKFTKEASKEGGMHYEYIQHWIDTHPIAPIDNDIIRRVMNIDLDC